MNLSLTGNLGSGKSSLGKELIARGFQIVSSGDIFRGLAAEKGVSIVEMNKIAETDKSIDKMVDDRTIELGKTMDHTIFDSRMGWYFVPDSFKVFVMVDLAEAGRRVYHDSLRKAESYEKEEDAIKALYTRQSLEKARYQELYGVNYYDLDQYDLVIDSTNASPAEIAEEIIRCFEQFEAGDTTKHIEISPYRIYPTVDLDTLDDIRVEHESGENEEDGTCFSDVLETVIHNGHWFAAGEHEKLLAAQIDKKRFLCVSVNKDAKAEISAKDAVNFAKQFEEKAGFTYLANPSEEPVYSNEKMYW